ncbi:MAG: class I SAM-dependent methyltransferase [Patulibacter sp.]|nr:class I SAM-dependent methyltransferase [Patulibacter sp.]
MLNSLSVSHADELEVLLPKAAAQADDLDQHEEWCQLVSPEGVQRIRFHDYDVMFSIPGLYERIYRDEVQCTSPTVVRDLLTEDLQAADVDPASLRVLDLGAGNGMVAEELRELGVETIFGLDILPEAKTAAERDRPGVYEEYHVADLTAPNPVVDEALRASDANCLTTVAALGFGDIPPRAFANTFDYLDDGGWVAMTIKDDFVTHGDQSGFSQLLQRMNAEGALEIVTDHRYQHRLAVSGEPLFYHAYVARKRGDIEATWIDDAELVGA